MKIIIRNRDSGKAKELLRYAQENNAVVLTSNKYGLRAKATELNIKNIEIIDYKGLTVDLCRQLEAPYLIRGLRNGIDFQYEKDMAEANRLLWPDLQTIFVPTLPEYSCISSSVVRDVFRHGGDYSRFLPKGVTLK